MEKTTDYKIFKTIRGNRDIYETHVEQLREAIRAKNLLPYYPILCNEHMQVIDGQHKLAVAKLDKLEVTYAVVPGLTLEDVMSINTHSKGWTIHDFVEGWIKAGKTDYQLLKDFVAETGFSVHIAATLLMNGNDSGDGGHVSAHIKDSTFEVKYLEYARLMSERLDDLKRYCDFPNKGDRGFIRALGVLYRNPDFDFDVLLSKLRLGNLRIEPRKSVRYYILHLDDLYNWKNKKRVDLYSSSQSQ